MGDSQFQQPISGNITAISQSIDLTSPNSGTEIIQVAGTWVGTLIIEGSNDGITYYSIKTINRSSGLLVANISTNGSYESNTNGFQFIRIRSSAWTSGTANISVYGSDVASLISTDTLLRGATDGTPIGNVGDALKFSAATSDRTGIDTITALNDTVLINSNACSTVALTITGTWIATLSFEATVDNTNWVAIDGVTRPGNLINKTTTTNNTYIFEAGGFLQFRVRASLFTSGIATVAWVASAAINLDDPTYGNNFQTAPTQSQLVSGIETETGNMYPLKVDNEGRLVTSALTGFGANFTFGDITTTALTRVLVKRTTYTEQTTNAQRSIASASANDTAAGTGARTVKITYFDQTGAGPFTETVTLNGITYVNTVATNICFIEQIDVVTAGSTGSNVGILTLKAATAGGGTTIGTIAATNNQTFWAHHYVAVGKTCNITGISCGHNGTTVGSGALFTLNAKPINIVNAVEAQISDFVRLYGQTSTFSRVYTSPIKVVGPARIQAYVTPETTSSTIYRCAFDFFEP